MMNRNVWSFVPVLFLIFPILVGCQVEKDDVSYYVAPDGSDTAPGTAENPLASIQKAIDLITRASGDSVDYRIVLKEGMHTLHEPVVIDESLGKAGKLTLCPDGESAPVVSGGKRIEGKWVEVEDHHWVVQVEDEFNQLFAGDDRLTRARWPNGPEYIHPIEVRVGERYMQFGNEVNLDFHPNGETLLCATGQWHFIRQKIESTDQQDRSIRTTGEIGPECSSTKVRLHDRIYFENAIEFLDREGEWFLDKERGELHLVSKSDPNTGEFFYPKLETLFLVEGASGMPVSNIIFQGLSFRHTTWKLTEAERKGIQAGYWGTTVGKPVYSPPAALMFRNSEKCGIADCTFENLGEGALAFEEGTGEVSITDNVFRDVGSNVVQVARISNFVGRGHPLHYDYEKKEQAPHTFTIANNHFQDGASVDLGGVGIVVGYANHITIRNNLIEDFPYTGISVGWRWGDDGTLTNSHHNIIEYNKIRRCMKYLSDGSGIYTVGNQPGTRIENNWIYDLSGGEMLLEGIYTDEGSGSMVISGNYTNRIKNHDYKGHRNLWETMVIENNGCEGACENILEVENERVRVCDFPDHLPPDTTVFGLLKEDENGI